MINLCYSIIQKHWNGKERLFIYRAVKVFLLCFYPLYIRFTRPRGTSSSSQVIVSLTSFPARINKVYLVIQSLLRQTVPPQKVILWLAAEQFENHSVPDSLRQLEKYGLEIAFCEDLRSHKKYYYSMLKYPDSTIVTADDDMLYPENWVENLTEAASAYPNTVICMLAHKMLCTSDGKPVPYEQWPDHVADISAPRYDLMPVGCEGVLYPPGTLHKDLFDKDFFMTACRNADDLWLKTMSLINHTKVMMATTAPFTYVNLPSAKIGALNTSNVGQNQNDVQLTNILNRYPHALDLILNEDP